VLQNEVREYLMVELRMAVDRFGNPHAPNLPYARGKILSSTEDDFQKLELAWALIRERGPRNIYICDRAGNFRFATMEAQHVAKLRDEKAAFPHAANNRVKALRQLFAWAMSPEYGYAKRNPGRDVTALRGTNPDGIRGLDRRRRGPL
jgi:hypothetical protein